MRRPFRLLVTLGVIAAVTAIASPAGALSCSSYKSHDEFVRVLATDADQLFTGVVLRRRDVPPGDALGNSWAYDFHVESVLKGAVREEVTVRAPSDADLKGVAGGGPGLRLETGKRTFVAAYDGRAQVLCGTLTTQELVDLRVAEVQRALGLGDPTAPGEAPAGESDDQHRDEVAAGSSPSSVMPWVAAGAIVLAAAAVLLGLREPSGSGTPDVGA